MAKTRNVFIVGSKGTPAKYGGFETFVDNLVSRKQSDDVKYFVACRRDLSDNKADLYDYNDATCFNIDVPNAGPAKAILYDLRALVWILKYIRKNNIRHVIVYILACRIGPFLGHYRKLFKPYDTSIFVNPDGHEWMRAKWSYPVKKYWKYSEKLMVKHADLLVCDSEHIQLYIRSLYRKFRPETTFLAYGAEVAPLKKKPSVAFTQWMKKKHVQQDNYYLIVGRFVPENNYLTMISEFLASSTDRDLVIVTKLDNSGLLSQLESETHFDKDPRVKFVGTVYNPDLLTEIRQNAFAYIHGHEVGGTNPSLLEALGTTRLNLLLDVGFNREVGDSGAIYWTKSKGSLKATIAEAEGLTSREIENYAQKSKQIITQKYNWPRIVGKYENLFLNYKNL